MSPNQIHEIKKDMKLRLMLSPTKEVVISILLRLTKCFLKIELSSNKSGYTTSSGNSALHRILELQDKNNLKSLYIVTNGKSGNLWKLYQELSFLAS
jgi:hypothetical protein